FVNVRGSNVPARWLNSTSVGVFKTVTVPLAPVNVMLLTVTSNANTPSRGASPIVKVVDCGAADDTAVMGGMELFPPQPVIKLKHHTAKIAVDSQVVARDMGFMSSP